MAGEMDTVQLTLELKISIEDLRDPRWGIRSIRIFDLLCSEREDLRVKVVHKSRKYEMRMLEIIFLGFEGYKYEGEWYASIIHNLECIQMNDIPVFQSWKQLNQFWSN